MIGPIASSCSACWREKNSVRTDCEPPPVHTGSYLLTHGYSNDPRDTFRRTRLEFVSREDSSAQRKEDPRLGSCITSPDSKENKTDETPSLPPAGNCCITYDAATCLLCSLAEERGGRRHKRGSARRSLPPCTSTMQLAFVLCIFLHVHK